MLSDVNRVKEAQYFRSHEFSKKKIIRTVIPTHDNCFLFTAPYIKQCREDDPRLVDCIMKAIDHLRPYLRSGKCFCFFKMFNPEFEFWN